MTLLREFKAYLPNPETLQMVIAPPYDVLDFNQARQIAEKSAFNIIHVTRPEVDCPGKTSRDPACYQAAKHNLNKLLAAQYHQSNEAGYLIYRITKGIHQQTGIVGLLHLDSATRQHLKTHEHTRPQKVADRSQLLQTVQAQISPVLLTIKNAQAIKSLLEESILLAKHPLLQVEDEAHYVHQIWKLSPQQSQELATTLSSINDYYIADGHHRCAAAFDAQQTQTQQQILSVVFPEDELRILGYHRVIKHHKAQHLIKQLTEEFSKTPMREVSLPRQKHHVGLYHDTQWYTLELKEESQLAVSLLHEQIIKPYFDITDPRNDERIDFIGGETAIKQIEHLVETKTYDLGFTLYPTQIEEILSIADADEIMPPKSTWFEPKLLDGLFIAK